ncbi:MAG: hypothetical protein Kow0090_01790 [Myxococcota bacterium]
MGMENKRAGVIGAGVVGSILSAHLAKAGCEVYVVDADKRMVDAVNRGSIKISGAREVEGKAKKAFTDISSLYDLDLDYVFVCVKSFVLYAIEEQLAKFNPKKTYVISFQNGIDTEEFIAGCYPSHRVIRVVINYAGGVVEPGAIKMTFFHPPNYVGCYAGGALDEAKKIAELLTSAGLESEFTHDIREKAWVKSILNAAMMPTSVVTRLTMRQIMELSETKEIVVDQLREFIAVAKSEKIKLEDDFMRNALKYLTDAGDHRTSMLMDFERGNRLEMEFLNQKLQEYADKNGVPCPTNKIMLNLIKGMLLHRENQLPKKAGDDAVKPLKSALSLKQTMEGYFARLKSADETRKEKIAWCTSVGPAELLYSMGFKVFFPENHAALIGASKNADRYITKATSEGFSPDTCSYMTSDIGAFLSGETPLAKFGMKCLPRPDILVFNTNQCSIVRDWFSHYAKRFNAPLIGINTPLTIDNLTDTIIDFVTKQYEELVPTLETVSGRKFDIDRFRETVELSREACGLWSSVLKTARNKPSPLTFFDGTIHMGPIVIMRGTQAAVDYYRELLKELEERVASKTGALTSEKFRLYWDGMPIWGKLRSLSNLFAKLESCVVASTYCNSWAFDDFDQKDPFRSSAYAYSKLFIARSDDVKEAELEKLFKEFAVDGVIYHDTKTCPRNTNNHNGLQVRLFKKTGIPYIEIQGDMNDMRLFSEEQTYIMLETFRDQLKMGR